MPNRSMPPGTIIPVLGYPEVEAAARWLCNAFGFRERLRIGSHRVQLVYGDASIVVTVSPATSGGGSGSGVMVRVDDARRHHDVALAAGASILSPPVDFPYGERQYTATDPAGHLWTFSQSIGDVDPASWGGVLIDDRSGPD